jgi:hypothetical protein
MIPNGYGDYHSNPTMVVHSCVPMFSLLWIPGLLISSRGAGGGEEELGPNVVLLLFE